MKHGGSPFNYVIILVTYQQPFLPLSYPHHLDFLAPFHTMWPRIDNENILKPVCAIDIYINSSQYFESEYLHGIRDLMKTNS